MNLKTIIDRISAECASVDQVGYLTDIKKVETAADDTPAVFAFWSDDAASPNDGAGSLKTQATTMTVSLLVIAKVPEGATDTLQDVRAELFAALVGWESDNEELAFSGGSVESIDAGLIRWRDNYQFTRYLRYTR